MKQQIVLGILSFLGSVGIFRVEATVNPVEVVSVVLEIFPALPNGSLESEHVDKNGSVLLAQTGSSKDIQYFLYTKQNPTPVKLSIGNFSALKTSGFIRRAPVKILTHGWMGGLNSSFPQDMKNAYLQSTVGDINVILTDWSPLSKNPNYLIAASNVKLVANVTAHLIKFLVRANVARISDFHLVGHSLGAHISGIAGQKTQSQLNMSIPRISGLDPAKPVFGLAMKDCRIDKSDGDFVDIIHTTGYTVGIFRTVGHADFYPNGGIAQEGCNLDLGCSHSRAYQYFTESITDPEAFNACPCPPPDKLPGLDVEYPPLLLDCKCSANDTFHMGEHASNGTSGVFHLTTNPSSPYSK